MASKLRKGKPGVKSATKDSASKTEMLKTVERDTPIQKTPLGKQALMVVLTNVLVAIIASAYLFYTQQGAQWASKKTEGDAIYTVVDLPGRGKGIIAARDIKQSELILTERPLFTVPTHISSSPTELISSKIEALSIAEREAFLNLSYVNFPSRLNPDDHPDEVALAIFQTNAVSVGDDAGIFPNMARLNHGCSSAFNVVYFWRENENLLYVHALKDIPKGKELLTTYTNSRKPRDERRAYLRQQYGFHCTCEVCSLPDDLSKASDERLASISNHYEEFARWGNEEITGLDAMDHIRKIWQLEEQEGYWSERGQLAADAAWIAAAHSDFVATQAWAGLAEQWYSYELGGDAPQVNAIRAVAVQPRIHQAWGKRTPLTVGGPALG